MIIDRTVSYAQNREDIVLAGFFGPDEEGFYVDVGAYDPEYDSVTEYFYRRKWRGINVEPQPERLQLFVGKRPRDINVNTGIADKEGILKLRSYKNQGLSTFSDTMKQSYAEHLDDQVDAYNDISVKVTTLEKLLAGQNVQSIQFMKVDVEGLEYEVLAGNNWKKYRPEVICIEANHVQKDWRQLLITNDYSLTFDDGLNEYYTDNRTERAKKFDYIEAVVFREPIVHYKLLEDFGRYDEAVAWLEDEIRKLHAELEADQEHIRALQTALDEITSLRRHIKKFVRYQLGRVDRKITNRLESKNQFSPKPPSTRADKNGQIQLSSAQANDKDNYSSYNSKKNQSSTLSAYKKLKRGGLKGYSRMRKRSNKKND